MENIKRVVSIGAHPLDAELIGGPLIIKYSKLGAKCTFMHVTQGRLEDPNATKEENDAYIKDLINQNINVASAMNAEKLIILTDVPGVLRDPNDPTSLIQKIRISEVPDLIEQGVITGGMIPKIETCVNAIKNGVKSCHIIDGRKKHSLLLEIFTTNGIGTMIFE